MNKIYLVKMQYFRDDEDREEIRVCKTLEKAKEVLKNMAIENCKNIEFDKIFCNDDLYFYAENDYFNITIQVEITIIEE